MPDVLILAVTEAQSGETGTGSIGAADEGAISSKPPYFGASSMTTTSISELAPCPFCDKQSAIQVFEADDIGGWLAGCCAQTWGDTEAEAIAAWNTRSIPTAAPDDAAVERARFITTWRKTDNVLEWDHYVSESGDEAARVVGNLKHQGVRQYHTYALGAAVDELSTLIARAALTASIPDAAPESDHG